MGVVFHFRDTPEADVVGCNLYQRYIDKESLSDNRKIPDTTKLKKQTVKEVLSILVCTGIYRPGIWPEPDSDDDGDEESTEGREDFPRDIQLYTPTKVVNDVEDAVKYILKDQQERLEETTMNSQS